MEKEMEKEKNIMIIQGYNLKENIWMVKDGMEYYMIIMVIKTVK